VRKRMRLSRKHSRKVFRKGARRVHAKNAVPLVNRGGFRI